jgi:phosphonate transport system permease protein
MFWSVRRMAFNSWLLVCGRVLLFAALVSLIVWSFVGLQFDFTHFGTGLGAGAHYVGRMFPQKRIDWHYDLSLLQDLWDPFLTTVQMAVVGTTLGAILAFPVSFLAARTGSIPKPVSALVKTYLNVSRAVPTIIYALIVVSAIGLGPSAGAIAISFVTFVSLAKLWAESLESVAAGPIEAVRAAGGNAPQIFVYGMLPQVFPSYLSTTLYSLEYNLKDSFIVGIVGAGGLGFQLYNAINLFKLLDAGVIVALLIVLVNLVDYLSYRVRLVFS